MLSEESDEPGRLRAVTRWPCCTRTTKCCSMNVSDRPLEKYSYLLTQTPE
jgi:hypothetical protein